MRKNLIKAEILRGKSEIAELFSRSSRSSCIEFCGNVQSAGLKLAFVVKFQPGWDQFFVSPAKCLGSAVQRNRAKCLHREFYRHDKQQWRRISQRAAETACRNFAEGPLLSAEEQRDGENLRGQILHFEQQLIYHWGLVIYREASHAQGVRAQFWPDARNPAFLGEFQRYQALLPNLEKLLCKQWSQFLRQLLLRQDSE